MVAIFILPLVLFFKFSPYPVPNIQFVFLATLLVSQLLFFKVKDFHRNIKSEVTNFLEKELKKIPSSKEIHARSILIEKHRNICIGFIAVCILLVRGYYFTALCLKGNQVPIGEKMKRPEFIKNCEELRINQSFSYPGDTETFGTGAALGRIMGLKRVAINYEVLAPGDRSSWPHAHSEEEEFIFILEGHPQVWIDCNIYDLCPGDCVGLPPGTGHAHCLLNNTQSEVKAIVVGEGHVENDKIFYPKHPARNNEIKVKGFLWENHPQNEIGPHDGWTDKKRPI